MFIKKIEKYFSGEMREDQAFKFWGDVILDENKFQQVRLYSMIEYYYKTQ